MVCLSAFMRVALGKSEGRAAPYIEAALAHRIIRIYAALRDGRDPNAAFDAPLPDEEPFSLADAAAGLDVEVG